MMNFDEIYKQQIYEYVSRIHEYLVETGPNEYTFRGRGTINTDIFYISKARRYEIPDSMWVSPRRVVKHNAHELCIGIHHKLSWHKYDLNAFDAFPGRCNLLDWVLIMSEKYVYNSPEKSKFYINCNVDSEHYGKIINMTENDQYGYKEFRLVKSVIPKIQEWMHVTSDMYKIEDLNNVIRTPVIQDEHSVMRELYKLEGIYMMQRYKSVPARSFTEWLLSFL